VFQGTPEPENGDATELVSPEEELEEEEETHAAGSRAPMGGRVTAGQATAATKHLVKDYSYVRAEIVRILGLAAFLIVALAITALLRG